MPRQRNGNAHVEDKIPQPHSGGRLYEEGQMPEWLRNPHITDGYRKNLSYQQCLKSVFHIHNETGNIWTHLLPAVLFFPLALYDFTVTVPGLHGNLGDYVAMATFHVSSQLGFCGSVYFHTFRAQGCRQIHDQCLGVDLWGVAMSSSGLSLLYVAYAFYCSWGWQAFYYSVIGGMITCYSVIWLHPRMVPNWLSLERRVLALFPLYVVLNADLHLHTLYHNHHWPDKLAQTMVLAALRPVGSLFVGIVVYLTRIPERWWPGRFNIWGHSHQWWHLMVVTLELLARSALIGFMQMRLQALC